MRAIRAASLKCHMTVSQSVSTSIPRLGGDNQGENSYCLTQLCSRGFSLIFASSVVMPRITQFSIPAWAARGDARRRRQGWPSL
jgi:hypothetical protein